MRGLPIYSLFSTSGERSSMKPKSKAKQYQGDIEIRTMGKGRTEYDFLNIKAHDQGEAFQKTLTLGRRLYPRGSIIVRRVSVK